MNANLESVRSYHVAGDDITVTFSLKDAGEIELKYEDEHGQRKFSGRQIHTEEMQLGFMISVVLEQNPDSNVVIFSLAVPAANRPSSMRSIPVETFAVRTTKLTSIGGPQLVEGQLQNYEIHVLKGNAF